MSWWLDFAHTFTVEAVIRSALALAVYCAFLWTRERLRLWYLRNT